MTNRYLEVERRLATTSPNGTASVAMSGSLPSRRRCCALGLSAIVEPNVLGGHGYGSGGGPTGYVYTATSGLIDLGHLRDMTDMVKFVDDTLAGGTAAFSLYEGKVAVTTAIPAEPAARLELAAAIAYIESWAHELATWDTIEDFSSFSPEDIPSNICGIEVGKRAISMGGMFDGAVDGALDQLLNGELGARPAADTKAVIAKVENDWYQAGVRGIRLLRRNFAGWGWPAGMPYDAGKSLPWLSPTVFESQFASFSFEMHRQVNGATVTLATMQATTNALETAWLAAHPGANKPAGWP